MGYNVKITYSNATIPAPNLEQAYERMCALNVTHHDEKYGGRYENGVWVERWFSWLSPNYPDELTTTEEILEELGFETEYLSDGSLAILDYDSKQGQEDLFLESIRDLTYGRIEWIGEDDKRWAMEFQEYPDLNKKVNVNAPKQLTP